MRFELDERGRRSHRSILMILAVIVVLYAVAAGAIYLIGSRLDNDEEIPENYGNLSERFAPTLTVTRGEETYSYHETYFTNILIIGVDQPQISQNAIQNKGSQADFLLLLSIDRRNRRIIPIHIDRDTYTEVQVYGAFGQPAGARDMQICLAHAFGGNESTCSKNTLNAVSQLLHGIPINYYLTMSMDGIAALNDALGGVTVTLEEDFSHIDSAMEKGATITLQGAQAEYYVRGRYGIGDYSNEQRMRHQRTYIQAALPALRSLISEDEQYIVKIFDEMEAHIDTSIPRTWLLNQAHIFSSYEVTEILSPEGEHIVGEDGFIEFHPDSEALLDLIIDTFFE